MWRSDLHLPLDSYTIGVNIPKTFLSMSTRQPACLHGRHIDCETRHNGNCCGFRFVQNSPKSGGVSDARCGGGGNKSYCGGRIFMLHSMRQCRGAIAQRRPQNAWFPLSSWNTRARLQWGARVLQWMQAPSVLVLASGTWALIWSEQSASLSLWIPLSCTIEWTSATWVSKTAFQGSIRGVMCAPLDWKFAF
jgi:hypothetical protein